MKVKEGGRLLLDAVEMVPAELSFLALAPGVVVLIEDVDRDVHPISGDLLLDIGVEMGRVRATPDRKGTDTRRALAGIVASIALAVLVFLPCGELS